jgi:hypothetical protein
MDGGDTTDNNKCILVIGFFFYRNKWPSICIPCFSGHSIVCHLYCVPHFT